MTCGKCHCHVILQKCHCHVTLIKMSLSRDRYNKRLDHWAFLKKVSLSASTLFLHGYYDAHSMIINILYLQFYTCSKDTVRLSIIFEKGKQKTTNACPLTGQNTMMIGSRALTTAVCQGMELMWGNVGKLKQKYYYELDVLRFTQF